MSDQATALPYRVEPDGSWRVGKTRVLVEIVLRAFKRGESPEAIVQGYPILKLGTVYSLVGMYLTDPAPFEEYLAAEEIAAAEIRCLIEERQGPLPDIKERARQRRSSENVPSAR